MLRCLTTWHSEHTVIGEVHINVKLVLVNVDKLKELMLNHIGLSLSSI